MDEMVEQLRNLLVTLIEGGSQLPITMTAVGSNGSLLHIRYSAGSEDDLHAEVLAEHYEGDMMRLPINIMFIDAAGEASRAVIAVDAPPRLVH